MDVIIRVIGWVILDDPIDLREVKTTLGNICAEQDAFFGLAEFKVCRSALLLLLFAVNILDWDVYIVEQVGVKLDSIAARHEDHDLFLHIFAQEGEK